ncbi:hypothetical protein N181_14065 [Sinorhizobium fredii USDA 205]|uniref:hypothetical protein n=1 Tax=Rhizobium fredii TaxID=380 RepID=UPI0004ADAA3C|nr:hypothetical protein [Sinorhizobium fredii]AWM25144.1 hypothetical protein AOX55_00001890 [Sinorhizobium fredii CCBAU 25509]KSV89690.1 hypothetical protein N181_14065 [Sinorhizobium fredii USDA 205]GEC31084.1 hypothetical protein EFR01_12550 [Sinorhizobium fredii]GLS12176.1 hypothetical protein GCM10007864_58080 [Sinorhizobium fredii]
MHGALVTAPSEQAADRKRISVSEAALTDASEYLRFIVDSGIFGVSLAKTFAYKPLLA